MGPRRIISAVGAIALAGAGLATLIRLPSVWTRAENIEVSVASSPTSNTQHPTATEARRSFIGPRENIPDDAPKAYGFWSFAVPVAGKLSRSGQPLISEFAWLKERGWKAVVNLRRDGERGEVGDNAKLTGFSDLGLNYLHLPITDGQPPTDEQAEQFLTFVTNPANQPVHIHCRGGIRRTGTMTALYRYAVQGWPLELAIQESRAFRGGVSAAQAKWLQRWAQTHPPGSTIMRIPENRTD